MAEPVRVAVLQLTSDADRDASVGRASDLVEQAAAAGAALVATPENTPFLGPPREKVVLAERLDGPTCARFAALAKRLGIHLLLGSFAERSDDPARVYNTSVLFGPAGERLASYRKLHLFDVEVGDAVVFRESESVVAGDEVVVVATRCGVLGLSICYDLRFPELYRALADRGANVIAVPSAFTATTGRMHWEVLLRARAIETQSWVLAPAQVGRHDDGGLRESFGHAMIVDPWGEVVADAGVEPGFVVADIDLDEVGRARRSIPVSEHRRLPS